MFRTHHHRDATAICILPPHFPFVTSFKPLHAIDLPCGKRRIRVLWTEAALYTLYFLPLFFAAILSLFLVYCAISWEGGFRADERIGSLVLDMPWRSGTLMHEANGSKDG
jgi:hypothetical protein